MHKTSGVLIVLLFGFVCIQGFAIESRSNGVNEEIYSKYVCNGKENGARIMVVGKCSTYYECKSGQSSLKTCESPNKFFDSSSGKCVATSTCIEAKGDCSTAKPKPTPPCNNNKPGTAPVITTTKSTTLTTKKSEKHFKVTKPAPPGPTAPTPSKPIKPQNQNEELEEKFAEYFGASGQKCQSSGGSCRGLPNGTLIPHKNRCNTFLICFNGCGTNNSCPASLHFNKRTLLCDKPENSKCDL